MTTRKECESPVKRILRAVRYGWFVGMIAGTALLLIGALVLTLADLPLHTAAGVAVAILGLAALSDGFVTARCVGEKGLLWGAAGGVLLLAAALLIGACLCRDVPLTSLWFRLIVAVLCGAIGGVLGVNAR